MALSAGSELRLGRVANLDVSMSPSGVAGTILNIVLFTLLGNLVFRRPLGRAVAGGVTLAGLHWASEFWHNLSHAQAARLTGHPMTGVRFGAYYVLGTSLYPEDEGDLPARVHITRALGGPVGSAMMSGFLGFVTLVSMPFKFRWVPLIVFLDNLFVFTVGAFVPLGFNDISTVIYWVRRRD